MLAPSMNSSSTANASEDMFITMSGPSLMRCETAGVLAVSVLWDRKVDVFDQGSLGSCTGNAGRCCVLGSDPYWGGNAVFGVVVGAETRTRMRLWCWYGAATKLDSYIGSYPPEDTGSDGLSVAKAAKNAGLISGYTHCLSIDAVVTALQSGPRQSPG